ncbi:hypothetical protein M3Y98_00058300 [Aphelenchoides besseyi]|nr:hypothetical protein M3Y98_00058300 [Aphelenchoides besseyi]
MVQFPKNSKEEAKSEKMKTFTGHVMVIGERYKCASGDVVRVVIEVDDPREGRNRELTVMGFEEAIDFLQALKPDGHYRWYNLRQPINRQSRRCLFFLQSISGS